MRSISTIAFSSYASVCLIPFSLKATPVVAESFNYELGVTIPGQGEAVDGWAGPWATSGGTDAELESVVEGQIFEGLEVSGGACQRTARFGLQSMARTISPASQSALTADSSMIWFSVLMTPTAPTDPVGSGGFAVNSWGTLVFGDTALDGASGSSAAPIGVDGNAMGVSFAGTGGGGDFANMRVQGVTYAGGVLTEDGLTTVGAETSLIVGSIEWAPNGSDDVLNLYTITDLAAPLPDPFITMMNDFDQSTFDVVSIGDSQTSVFDEIRFGLSLSDIIGGLGESASPEITSISYDASSEPDNILVTLTFDSKSGKTYTAYVTSDLTIPVFERTDIDDGIVGEEGSTTLVIDFNASALDKEVTKFFVVMVENL